MKQTLQHLSPGVFDLFAVGLIIFGIIRGRVRGMSQELLDVFEWLVIVAAGGFLYVPLGKLIASNVHLSLLFSYLLAYIGIMIVVQILFGFIKKAVGEKIVSADAFGSLEFYLGMIAGGVRYACMIIFVLAILNAKYVPPEQVAAQKKAVQENFGTITIPTISSMQQMVFKESMTGPLITKYLNEQLIKPTPYESGINRREGLGKKLENAVDEAMDGAGKKK